LTITTDIGETGTNGTSDGEIAVTSGTNRAETTETSDGIGTSETSSESSSVPEEVSSTESTIISSIQPLPGTVDEISTTEVQITAPTSDPQPADFSITAATTLENPITEAEELPATTGIPSESIDIANCTWM
jgi:hypothetical protein